MISALSKLSQRQPIQELAFHKEQWEINGVPFECHESYYEGELLNGIDLRVKAVKGLSGRDRAYDYLVDSQEVVFAASAHLMVYNTHKRSYHQLFSLQGEVQLLRTHLEKMNNREYIIWVEAFPSREEAPLPKPNTHSRVAKRTPSLNHPRSNRPKRTTKHFLKSIFSLAPDLDRSANLSAQEQLSSQAYSKTEQQEEGVYVLKVLDYARKEMVFEGELQVTAGHTLKELFLFWNHHKIVGYVTEDYENNLRCLHYLNLQAQAPPTNSLFPLHSEKTFSSLQTKKHISSLLFNNELNHFLFPHAHTLNVLFVRESDSAEHELFKQFLSMSEGKEQPEGRKKVCLEIEERLVLEEDILSLTINDQYLAILTRSKIYFHSAFDLSSLIFLHTFEPSPKEPLSIEFNKNALMLTRRNSTSIFTYTIKNKALKLNSETVLALTHCKEILRIFTNPISSQIFCVVLFYELQSKYSCFSFREQFGSKGNLTTQLLEGLVQYVQKPSFIDIAASFLAPAGSTDATILGISRKRFRKVHTCPWLSGYMVETQEAVELGEWRENFENKKCVCVHPSGLFLVVCLKEAFRVYVVTREGFVNSYRGDAVKDIQACAIAAEGNHLAVCSPNCIFIYDFYSCARLRSIALPFGVAIEGVEFRGHSLVCYLRNKKIYLFDSLNEYKESLVFNPKSVVGEATGKEEEGLASTLLAMTVSEIVTLVTYSPVFYCPLLHFFIFSYRSTVYFYNCASQAIQASVQLQPLSCLHYCANLATLFMGTTSGELICFPWPNKPTNLQSQQRKFKLHAGRVVDIRVSSDLRQLVTIGQDESLVVSAVVLVQNLKRFEGLELVEHLSGGARICYDFLSRRGVCLFTHSKWGEKCDQLKDYEDEVLNANFILPEERQKQKEQMFTNVKQNMKDISEGNRHLYDAITTSTNQARDQVNRARYDCVEAARRQEREKEDLKQAMYAEYIAYYNKTEASCKEQQETQKRFAAELECMKIQLANEEKREQEECMRRAEELAAEQEQQMGLWRREDPAELSEIEEEKRQFIAANVGALEEVLVELNNNNGVLACRNNNLEKEMGDLRRKIEEHRYLLYRLEANTVKLREEQTRYQSLKSENKRQVEREDRVNLTEIEKRYVRQTQTLIERDKEINVQLVNYQKEKNILIHLEKCLEGIEASIETLVGNILQEKKDRKEDNIRIQQTHQQAQALLTDSLSRKKEKISTRNQLHNYLCRLEAIVEDVLHTRSSSQRRQLLLDRQLIDSLPPPHPQDPQEKDLLSKILSQKVQALSKDTSRPAHAKLKLLRSSRPANSSSTRVLRTEGSQSSPGRDYLASTCRQAIEKRSREVYMRLDAEQKQYERIRTEQLVFENTRKKFNLENQDLIENYNSLAMENKKILNALRRQESLTRMPAHRQKSLPSDTSPTPFQLYLANKANTNTTRKAFVPLRTYQGQ